ncbi:MAG TPA: hypothetical protein VD963_00945 [Phycisphaerales bacterium]|nr:hypothetical protein [Phycisphaerales bacterium]
MKRITYRLAVGTAAAALFTGVASAQTVADYTAVDVGLLPGAFSNVPWGMNNAGEVVGWNQGPLTILRAYVWRPGQGISELPPPAGYSENQAADISNTGIIVGSAHNGGTSNQAAWRRVNGVYQILPSITGCASNRPVAVNDLGAVVGHSCPDSVWDTPGRTPWYYSDETGLINLAPLGFRNVGDVNNAGVVTGNGVVNGVSGALRWQAPAGPVEVLPMLPAPYNDSAMGEGINEAGQVVGTSINILTGSDTWRAFLNTPGGGTEMVSNPVTARSSAYAINESGHIVGTDGTTSTTDIYGWVWTPESGKRFIYATHNGSAPFHANRSIDINDSGQVVCRAANANTPSNTFVLTPIAPPPPPPCPADFNTDGAVTTSDVSAFLSAWFTDVAGGGSAADFDDSGATTTADISAYLSAWFTAIAAGGC